MTLNIDGESFTTEYQYNEDGRLSRVSYPSGMDVDNTYDINGLIKRMSIPYSDIWDSQYIQLENALQDTAERILELEAQASSIEQNAQTYIRLSEIHRQSAQKLYQNAQRLDTYAARFNRISEWYLSLYNSHLAYANHMRSEALRFWNHYQGRVFALAHIQNGYAYYRYDRCVSSNIKGCKHRETYLEPIPYWMISNVYNCSSNIYQTCSTGPKNSINIHNLAMYWANYYQQIANVTFSSATAYSAKSDDYQRFADNAEARARQMTTFAQKYASLARQQTDLLENVTDELEDQVAAHDEIERIFDERLNDETAQVVWMATSRDQFGRVGGELFGNGLLTRREIDRATGAVTRITTGTGANLRRDVRYQYDQRNNVTSKINQVLNREEYYQYDGLDRLTHWTQSNNQTVATIQRDYQYDVYGNLTYKTGQGSFDVASNGQLQSAGYSYDANGNMLTGRGRTIAWNSFNKARSINDNGNVVQYEYGAERERVKQVADGKTIYYVSPDYQLERSVNSDGESVMTMRHRFIVDNQAVAEHVKTLIGNDKQVDKTAFLHRDALGTATYITDQNGQAQIERSYTPFGEELAAAELQTNPLFTSASMRGFTGHETVGGGSGLINMNARLYDPVIGRFLSADSLVPDPSLSQSFNRYSYVLNNPVKYTDPTGHFWFLIGAAVAIFSQTFENPYIQMAGMVIGGLLMGNAATSWFSSLGEMGSVIASGATTSFSTGYIATGDLGEAMEAAAIGGAA
ncbi:RHS repeat domain-containing protein, partial [Vibrio sonorensis]|uniref:RHS repeat domain-containing protein n=1 Tax=Vibrio sonorensis TaxID=1004316 RepID=UPI000A90C3C3